LNAQLNRTGFSYDTYSVEQPGKKSKIPSQQSSTRFHRIDINFLQSLPNPEMIASSQQTGTLNYIGGQQPAEDVRKFRRVTYRNLYPKIDLVFEVTPSSSSRNFEYHFVAHPGGNAGSIRLQDKGAASTQIEKGQVVMLLQKGRLKENIPASYITRNVPSDIRILHDSTRVDIHYRQYGKDIYGFKIPPYNRKQSLMIDPVPDLQWGTYYGDDLNEYGYSIARDASGNIYVGGWTIAIRILLHQELFSLP
jgi:hypothetical protein